MNTTKITERDRDRFLEWTQKGEKWQVVLRDSHGEEISLKSEGGPGRRVKVSHSSLELSWDFSFDSAWMELLRKLEEGYKVCPRKTTLPAGWRLHPLAHLQPPFCDIFTVKWIQLNRWVAQDKDGNRLMEVPTETATELLRLLFS